MALRALAAVNVAAIERNCARLHAALTGGARLCAVVKADGYGHGAAEAARAALSGGATWIAVVTTEEAAALRRAGLEARLLVMGAVSDEELPAALGADADIVAWHPRFVEALERHANAAPGTVRVHVKLDTGMGRLGARDPDVARATVAAVDAAPGLELAGAMTHFATADELGDDFFGQQLARFIPFAEELRSTHPGITVHAANSAATLRDPAAHFDLVRCGIAVYGMDPFQADPAARELAPALELTSYVADVKPIGVGESAGYGRRFIAEHPTRIAVVPIGYGDGVRRLLTNNADVLIRGRRFPLVGTVSMDNVTIDVGDADVADGDEVVLLGERDGERVLAEEWARRIGTINYEITCGLTPRVPRLYHADGAPR
jgi:alanine racemase